jgi:hypothetical protein
MFENSMTRKTHALKNVEVKDFGYCIQRNFMIYTGHRALKR